MNDVPSIRGHVVHPEVAEAYRLLRERCEAAEAVYDCPHGYMKDSLCPGCLDLWRAAKRAEEAAR